MFLAAVLVLLANVMLAQQQPHYTQYIINNYILNPAIAGIENYTDVKLSHRHQWVGAFNGDEPVTTYFTLHMPLGKKDYRTTATSFNMDGENPRGKSYREDYSAAAPHHGLGYKIIIDRTGPLNRFAGYVSYAYHIGIGPKTSIAAGFEAGVRSLNLNASKLNFDPNNPGAVDPSVGNSNEINQIKPDFGAGVWVYSASYFIGLSAQQIIPQTVVFNNNSLATEKGKTIPHIFATAGYRFFVSDDITATPSIMAKFIQPTPAQVDVNVKFQYRDRFWAGAGYRFKYGFNAMLGLNISNTFNVSYSYDYSTTRINTISTGSHEIVLGFLLGNKYGDWCPKNVW